jgi:hypothetical protein
MVKSKQSSQLTVSKQPTTKDSTPKSKPKSASKRKPKAPPKPKPKPTVESKNGATIMKGKRNKTYVENDTGRKLYSEKNKFETAIY